MPKKPPVPDLLRICDRGETCPNRNIPLVDVYLTCSGAMWLQHLHVSIPFAQEIQDWCRSLGIKVESEEPSADPEHQRNLFSEVQ